jgi:hypothetical protein
MKQGLVLLGLFVVTVVLFTVGKADANFDKGFCQKTYAEGKKYCKPTPTVTPTEVPTATPTAVLTSTPTATPTVTPTTTNSTTNVTNNNSNTVVNEGTKTTETQSANVPSGAPATGKGL